MPGGLEMELSFDWRGDRWGHTLTLTPPGGGVLVLVASEEGTPEQVWPPSPPLQALDRQTLADGRPVALLVGMAGRSHWSASVELDFVREAIRFDLACRHAGQPGWIGSTCRLTEAGLAHLMVSALPGTRIEVARTPQAGWAGQFRAWPVEIPAQAGTVRWGYELRLRAMLPAPPVLDDRPASSAAALPAGSDGAGSHPEGTAGPPRTPE